MSSTQQSKIKLLIMTMLAGIPIALFLSWFTTSVYSFVNNQWSQNAEINKYEFCTTANQTAKLKEIETGLVPEQIEISAVGINLPITSVAVEGDTWQVHDNVANYAQGTSLISLEGGSVGVYGHDADNVFAAIKDVSSQDEIVIYAGGYRAVYKLDTSYVTSPDSVDVFYEETDKPVLTLVTCQGVLADKRYIVRANLERIEELNCDE